MPSQIRFKMPAVPNTVLLPQAPKEIERVVSFLRQAGFRNISTTLEAVNNGKTTSIKHVITIYSTREKFNDNVNIIKAAGNMSKDLLIRCQSVYSHYLNKFSLN